MNMDPGNDFARISLDQWRALVAVVDHGGYARAAEALNKSQSAVTYGVQKIESVLGVRAFALEGRRAVLTTTGEMLYRRARALVDEAVGVERAARKLSAGWEPELWLAVEVLFPTWLLLDCLARFAEHAPETRIEVIESVLGGAGEALLSGQADIAITPRVPVGFLGEPVMRVAMVAAAHPTHPLHHLGRPLAERDLRGHRHLVVRDSGSVRDRRTTTVEVDQRWTVSHMATSIEAAVRGHGFAWLPEERVRAELDGGTLVPLPLGRGGRRELTLYLVMGDADFVGPGVACLAGILRDGVAEACGDAAPHSAAAPPPQPADEARPGL